MTIQRLPGSAITPGTITVTQLDSATATVIQTGGGPKITNIQVTDAAYTVIDDTAVDTAGGNIRITGTGFVTGCSVIVGSQPASSVAFISSTEVRVQVGAQSAGTYIVYLVNPDGGVGIRVNGLTYSANPAWQTASALPEQYDNVAISLSLVATEATSYTITSGSLPPGLSLNANTGVITGTVTGISVDTLYTFTVRATDAQLQDSPRTFTVTITVSDPYFRLTSLLLSGSALSANTVVKDSSTNNFNLTVLGDARASNFTPYGGAWSNYFSTGKLTVAQNAAFNFGTGNFTIECWINVPNTTVQFGKSIVDKYYWSGVDNGWLLTCQRNSAPVHNLAFYMVESGGAAVISLSYNGTFTTGIWHHVAVTRSGTAAALYFNGNIVASQSSVTGNDNYSSALYVGSNSGTNATNSFDGYISNLRIIKGQALFTGNFSPANSALSVSSVIHTGANVAASITGNVVLLTSQDNRLLDNSPNSFSFTKTNTVNVTSYNPFNITNTGVNGSIYLDGTGDYVTTPTSQAPLALDTANFTVECWVYFSSGQPQTNPCILSSSVGSSLANTILLQFGTQPSTQIALWVNNVHLTASATNNNLVFNAWNHIAVCRTGGSTYSFFINGIAVNSVASNSTSLTANDWRLGYWFSGAHALLGYITDFRIIKGTALYSSNFTPPTAPLTAVTNTQLLTFQFDQPHNNHTFLDSSSNQFLLTRYGNATQGTFSPFSQSGWSVLFNGSSGITLPNNANYGVAANTDFCWEAFIYMTSLPASNGHYAIWNNRNAPVSACGWQFGFANNSGTYAIVGTLTSGSTDTNVGINLVNQSLATANQWHHIALVRHSGVIYGYWNGVSQGTLSYTSSINAGAGVSGIGWRPNGYNDLYLSGYVSNFRFVNGSAVYPSGTTFTVPTTPLTAVTNTVLLTAASNRFRDLSTQNATVSVQSAPSVQAFAPFAATALYSAVVHGGSAYFDGSGDYLWCLNNVVKQFEPSPSFTFEVWYYDDSTSTAGPSIFEIGGTTLNWNASTGVHIQLNTNYLGSQYFNWSKGDGATTSYTWTAPPSYQWNHFAVCYNGTTTSGWLNGARVFTSTTGWPVPNYDRFSVGGNNVTPGSYFKGYVSNLRWVSGTALYNVANTAIVVPTAPLTSLSNTKLLLNFTDAAIFDSTGRNLVETVGDAKTSGVITKFTGGSMSFDGTGDWIITSQPPSFYNLPGNFTIEFWIYIVAAGSSLDIMGTANNNAYIGAGQSGWVIAWSTTAGLRFGWQTNNTWSVDGQINSTNRIVNAWAHIAVVRNGSTITGYVNGSSTGATLTSSTNLTSTLYSLYIGAGAGNQGGILTGYLSDIRITRDYARYTTNFTAPTVPARLK